MERKTQTLNTQNAMYPRQSDIQQAVQYTLSRKQLQQAAAAAVKKYMIDAAAGAYDLSAKYNIPPKQFQFSRNKKLEKEVDDIIRRLQLAITQTIRQTALQAIDATKGVNNQGNTGNDKNNNHAITKSQRRMSSPGDFILSGDRSQFATAGHSNNQGSTPGDNQGGTPGDFMRSGDRSQFATAGHSGNQGSTPGDNQENDDDDDDRLLLLAYLASIGGKHTVNSLACIYADRFKYELEAFIAAALAYNISKAQLLNTIKNALHEPYTSPLLKKAFGDSGFSATRIRSRGITYGQGQYKSSQNAINRLLIATIGIVWWWWYGHKIKRDGAAFFYQMRGSSYPCPQCYRLVGFYPIDQINMSYPHAHCYCIRVPVYP